MEPTQFLFQVKWRSTLGFRSASCGCTFCRLTRFLVPISPLWYALQIYPPHVRQTCLCCAYRYECSYIQKYLIHLFRTLCVFIFSTRDAHILHWLLFSVNSVTSSTLAVYFCVSKRAGVHGVSVLGITVDASLEMFLDTCKGQEYLQKHSIAGMLKNDTTLYVPAEYFPILTAYEEVPRSKDYGLSFCAMLPLTGEFNNAVGITGLCKHAI